MCWWASSCLPSVSSSIPTVCIFIYTSGHTFKAEATPVQAVILAMRGANHESLGTPVVEYTVGGKTYTSTLNLSSSSMHPGKQITVYYRNGNPQEVRYLDDNNWIIGLLMAMAFVFAGMGLAFILVRWKHRQKIARLLATGDTVEAEITGIREDDNQSMNGRHPRELPLCGIRRAYIPVSQRFFLV